MTYVGRSILVVSIVLLFLGSIVAVFLSITNYWWPEWFKQLLRHF
jgi:hypothetical protein